MRFSAHTAGNLLAWAVLLLLLLAALLVADLLGFVGLAILGCITWLVCTRAQLDQDAPTWGAEVFRARMQRPRSPEERAAQAAERETTMSPLRFYGRCGMALAAIGAAGVLWGAWRG